MLPDPTELIAAVLTGWAVAWLMTTLGIPSVPMAMAALLIFAVVSGSYRRRYLPPGAGRPDPGA